jgi:NADH-quinone oxidoreductase subunit M
VNEIPWLTILTFVPLIFALAILALPKDSGKLIPGFAFIGTLVTLVISLWVYGQYHMAAEVAKGHQFPLSEIKSWIPALHINYFLGMDGISLLMVLMTTGIFPFVVGVSFNSITERTKQFYFWVLLMETAILGVFLSLDLVLFYIFWEAMLIPMYFIIGSWGGSKRIYATVKFFLYTMVGSMVMLVSIMALYFIGGSQTFDLPTLQTIIPSALGGHEMTEILLFLGFFLAFGIKAPIWPFHTWVPDAYAEAPTGGTIILVALKMGLYGFIRFCLPLFPAAVAALAPIIIVFSVIGVVYAAIVACMQTDLKRLIAYSSVSHIGVIMLAIFGLTGIGISGAVLQMVSHTITTGALFIILGILYARRQTYMIADYGGLMKVMPAFTVVFLIATLSSVALPLTSGFTGEILMLVGSFQTHPVATGFATTAAIWSVVYMLWMFQRVMYGKLDNPANHNLKDLTKGEYWALVPLVLLIFAIGVYPKPLLDAVNPSVKTVLEQSGVAYSSPFPAPIAATAQINNVQPAHLNTASALLEQPKGNLP